jgi:fructokinase
MGELLVEFVATTQNVSLAEAAGFVKAPGGAPANVAVAIQLLGLSSRFVGKVGDDPFGHYLKACLDDYKVDTRYLAMDKMARTTAVFDTVWDDGHKDLCFYRNPGADMMLRPEEIVPSIFEQARAFHFGSISFINEPSASAQRRAISMARERGLMMTFDPNYRPTLWPDAATAHRVIFDAFRDCHLAKISAEEWEVATGQSEIVSGTRAVLGQGVELLVISRGAKGAVATNGNYYVDIPAFEVEVVETTGAGDGFMASLIASLLPIREAAGSLANIEPSIIRRALRRACAMGALTCMKPGAIPALPTLDELQRFLSLREL